EIRRVLEVRCRIQEVRMVEDVEEVKSEGETHFLSQLRLLSKRGIQLPMRQASQDAPSRAPILAEERGPEILDCLLGITEQIESRPGLGMVQAGADLAGGYRSCAITE